MSISLLATRPPRLPRTGTLRSSKLAWGILVHTTGRGVPTRAKDTGLPAHEIALAYYLSSGANFPHYLIAGEGTIWAVADETVRAWHAGITTEDRAQYLTGEWETQVSPEGLAHWRARWPGIKSPQHLYPGKSPNEIYIGVELIPSNDRTDNGTLFTTAQYAALSKLIQDVATRHGFIPAGARLLGHEDVSPLTRWDKQGGWDPGFLRDNPLFRWDLVVHDNDTTQPVS